MVVFRSIKWVSTPPKVSIPKESGVTSNKRISSTSPASTPPCIAAPKATTSSGLTLLFGSRPNISFTFSCILGILDDPPTSMTSLISEVDNPASESAFLLGSTIRFTKSDTRSSNFALDKLRFKCLGPELSAVINGRLISVCFEEDNSFLAASAASFNLWRAIASFLKSIPSLFLNSSAIQSITF